MNRALPTFNAAEERNKLSHFTAQGYDLKGIVQAGAGDGEEFENAIRLGVEHYLAFEPLGVAFEALAAIPAPVDYHRYMVGLHDKNGFFKLQVTAGDGKGSSIFDTVWDHPEVMRNWNQGQAAIIGTEEVKLVRFDSWAGEHPEIDLGLYDTLQLDTQGNEMEILWGMGGYLRGFKYLCIELSEVPVYVGETPGQEVIDWLDKRGFLLDSPLTAHNDTFFIRKDIKSVSDQIYKGRC